MTFYNNRVVVIEDFKDSLYIVRKIKNELFMEYINKGTNIFQNEKLVSESIGEFDIDRYQIDDINILFINDNHDLILSKLIENTYDKKIILSGLKTRIFDLALINIGSSHNIFFMQETDEKHIYRIYHIHIEDGEQMISLVDEIETYQIINPLRIIKDDKNLVLAYYFKNQICLKVYNTLTKIWSPSITLTNNQNKLYLDILKVGGRIHLVYSDFNDDLFTIKYERFLIDNDYILKETELDLSTRGNNTDPILIYYDKKIWVIWKDTNQLLSIYSEDGGKVWSSVYQWKNSKKMDIVKYKYLTNILDNSIKIDYSYGSIKPDIKFVGFGNLKDAEALQTKKVIN